MLTYDDGDYIMIPMALNAFYHNISVGSKKIKYTKEVYVGDEFLEGLLAYIKKAPDKKRIVIDLESVSYAHRAFEKFERVERPLIFINIDPNELYEKMRENLPDLKFSADYKRATWNIEYEGHINEIAKDDPLMINHKIYVKIVQELIDKPERAQKLDSSGLYSNMYVNIKNLFLNPEYYYAILYGLAKEIKQSNIQYDGFITSSKNGAILGHLLGAMLGKKAVHVSGVGPKFSMNTGNLQKDVMKRKNYIYIFDFRCTGTEMKILSALVNANDAYVKGYLGIAVYRDDMEIKDKGSMFYLVDLTKEEIPFKVAGEEEDIAKLSSE